MSIFKNFSLRRQLRKAGAPKQEAAQLSSFAGKLGDDIPGLDRKAKYEIANQIGFKARHATRARTLELAGAFAVFLAVILFAQSALPGNPLYALKRVSENVAVTVDSGFEYNVVARRKAELESLKRGKADKSQIEAAKDDYDAARDATKDADDAAKQDNSGRGSSDDDTSGSGGSSGDNSGSGSSNSGSGKRGGSNDSSNSSGSSGSGRDHTED